MPRRLIPRGGVSLLEHILALLAEMDLRYQQRFDAQNTALDAARLAAKEGVTTALTAAEKAVTKAEIATENRLTLLNELRAGVATREQLDAIALRVEDLKARVDRFEGKSSGASLSWAMMLGAGGLILTLISVVVAVIVANH
jgi:hypothetical protein